MYSVSHHGHLKLTPIGSNVDLIGSFFDVVPQAGQVVFISWPPLSGEYAPDAVF